MRKPFLPSALALTVFIIFSNFSVLPVSAQVVQVHIYDSNALYPFGAPNVSASCSGMISGQSGIITPGGTPSGSSIIPISISFTIASGTLDLWVAPTLSGTSYTLSSINCTSQGQSFSLPNQYMVVPSPASNAITVTAATTPTPSTCPRPAASGCWSSTLVVVGDLSPWVAAHNGYLTSIANPGWNGGYLVTGVDAIASTITVQVGTASVASGGAPLVKSPASAWTGTGTLINAGPLTIQQVLPATVPTPNMNFLLSQLSQSGASLGQVPVWNGQSWLTGNPGSATVVNMFGDVGGTSSTSFLEKLQGVPLSAASPTAGQGLVYDGGLGQWVPGQVGASGAAGGDLAGSTYPNPIVATVGGATAANVAAASVAAQAATASDTPSTLVKRDSSGNFSAGQITAGLSGTASKAAALLNTPTVCPLGQFPDGVDVQGNAIGCTAVSTSITGSSTVTVTPSGGGVVLSVPSSPTFAGTTSGSFSGPLAGNVTGNVSGSAATFTSPLIGDVTGTQPATVVGAINGTTVPVNSTTDAILQTGGATAVGFWNQWSDCSAPGYHITYNRTTHAIGCDNVGGSGGSVNWNGVGSGTNSNALLISGTFGPTGGGVITATAVPYSGLTGGVPTWNQSTSGNAATATALAATPSQCSGVNFAHGVTANGSANCAQPTNVTGSAASITGNLTGAVTSVGMATTIAPVVTAGTATKLTYNVAGQVTGGAAAQFSDIGGTASLGQLPGTGALNITAGTGLTGGGSVSLGSSVTVGVASPTDPSWLTLNMGAGRIQGGSLGTGMIKNITGTNPPVLGVDGVDYVSGAKLDDGTLPADFTLLTTGGNATIGGSLTLNGTGASAIHIYNADGTSVVLSGSSTGAGSPPASQSFYCCGTLTASAPLGLNSGNQLYSLGFTGDATNIVAGNPTTTLSVGAVQGNAFSTATPTMGQTLWWNAAGSPGPFWAYSTAPSTTGQVNIWNATSAFWTPGTLPSIAGSLAAAQEPAHTGDVINTAGSLATTVQGIQGTGVTTSTPTVGQTFYVNTGTPPVWVLAAAPSATGQVNIWNNTSHLWTPSTLPNISGTLAVGQEPAHTGDVTNTAGSLAMAVGSVGSGSILTSAAGVLYPASDSTTAIQFDKSDGSTNVVTIDTTDAYVGIGTATPGTRLEVNGTLKVDGAIVPGSTVTTISGTSGTASCYAPIWGSSYKMAICTLVSYQETSIAQTFTFPTSPGAFTLQPLLQQFAGASQIHCGTYDATANTTALTLPANASMAAQSCTILVTGR